LLRSSRRGLQVAGHEEQQHASREPPPWVDVGIHHDNLLRSRRPP
jgi:hypothetical protein